MTTLVADGVLNPMTGYLSPVSDAYKKVSRIVQLWHSDFSRAKLKLICLFRQVLQAQSTGSECVRLLLK